MSQYIGSGNEVGVRISVVELGQPVEIEGYYGYYNYNMSIAAPSSYYYSERITMPDIYIKGIQMMLVVENLTKSLKRLWQWTGFAWRSQGEIRS